MTKTDKWIAGLSFILLLISCIILWFGSICLAIINHWFILLMPLNLAIVVSLVHFLAPYMRSWQEWADNVIKFLKRY